MKGKDLSGRVRELARIRTEEGFMAEWEKRAPGTYLLREHNCALYQIALCCEQACVFEEKLFRDVLEGAQVTRERHILTGAQCCEYLVREKR
jgi:predicted ArsR family transcriptional regulator